MCLVLIYMYFVKNPSTKMNKKLVNTDLAQKQPYSSSDIKKDMMTIIAKCTNY